MRRFAGIGGAVLAGCAVVALASGCRSDARSARQKTSGPRPVVAADVAQLLGGRRVAFGVGAPDSRGIDITDVWVLSQRGRLANVTRRLREAAGADQAVSFSLSPDGTHLAFILDTVPLGACGDCLPRLYVMRSDGTRAHRVGADLGLGPWGPAQGYWPPSWDRSGRSFVITAYDSSQQELEDEDDDTGLARIAVPSGRVTWLTPIGGDTYNAGQAVVSPDGREIAYLRSAAREPKASWILGTVLADVYVMKADGTRKVRLRLRPRPYSALWWCGEGTTVCVDAPGEPLAAYRVDVSSGKVTHLRHWPEAAYGKVGAVSRHGTFAVASRRKARTAEVVAGPVDAAGVARVRALVRVSHAKENPFFGFSVSGP